MHLPWRDMNVGPVGQPISTSMLGEEAAELRRLAEGKRVLEIGSAYGYSACVMAQGGASYIMAIDPHTWIPASLETMRVNKTWNDPNHVINIVPVPSFEFIKTLKPRCFDLVFIDGDHRYEAIRKDIDGSVPLVKDGGILAVHDYLEECCCPDVRRACDETWPAPDRIVGSMAIYQR